MAQTFRATHLFFLVEQHLELMSPQAPCSRRQFLSLSMQYLEHHTAAQVMAHLVSCQQRIGPDPVANAVHVHCLLDHLVKIAADGATFKQDKAPTKAKDISNEVRLASCRYLARPGSAISSMLTKTVLHHLTSSSRAPAPGYLELGTGYASSKMEMRALSTPSAEKCGDSDCS